MTQALTQLATHTAALLLYPGLLTIVLFGSAAETMWVYITDRRWESPRQLWRRPSAVQSTVVITSMLASVQLSAPFNPVPSDERNLIIAAICIGLIVWTELALGIERFQERGLLLVVQCSWLVAVLGPAVELQSLRPPVLGAVLVPSLLPLKVATGILYLLCLPALLKLWPIPTVRERRAQRRLDATRVLAWWPFCGLFATLWFPPSSDDLLGVARFLALVLAATAFCVLVGVLLRRRGAKPARDLYRKVIGPFGGVVLAIVIVTSLLVH